MTSEAFLSMTSTDLSEALAAIARSCKPDKGEQAVLRLDGENLVIDCAGMSIDVPASGTWPGEARIPAQFLLNLAKLPPRSEFVELQVEGDRLRIGGSRIACTWQDSGARKISLPVNPSKAMIYAATLKFNQQDLEASGYGEMAREATEWAEDLLAAAARELGPLEVDESNLRDFVQGWVKKRHRF